MEDAEFLLNLGFNEEMPCLPRRDHDLDQVAVEFARTFATQSGVEVLRHLRSITVERTLGPTTSDSFLRHMEGQRQLYSYVTNLITRGRSARPGYSSNRHSDDPEESEALFHD